jgi:hypothetical protein
VFLYGSDEWDVNDYLKVNYWFTVKSPLVVRKEEKVFPKKRNHNFIPGITPYIKFERDQHLWRELITRKNPDEFSLGLSLIQ